MVAGDVGSGRSRLEYALSVSNGRAALPTDVQTIGDKDGLNAVNLWLGFRPGFLRDLMVGGVVRRDRIPAAPDLGRNDRLKERILGGYAAYRTVRSGDPGRVPRHTPRGGGVHRSLASSRRAPMSSFRARSVGSGPTTASTGRTATPTTPSIARSSRHSTATPPGLRFDPHPWVTLKVEGSAVDRKAGGHDTVGVFQAAFTF